MPEEIDLSEREIEIIRLVATGASNKEIATSLTISPNTVKVHLRNIFGKLGVLSRTEATMAAIKLGLVEAPGKSNQSAIGDLVSSTKDNSSEEIKEDRPSPRRKQLALIVIGFVIVSVLGVLILNRLRSSKIQSNSELTQDQIQEINSSRWVKLSPMPEGESGMAFVRYENKYLFFGGENNAGISKKSWVYDPEQNIWAEGIGMPKPLSEIQAAILGGKIYLPGGKSSENLYSKDLLIFDPRDHSWDLGPELPTKVSGYSLVAYEGQLFLFGGFDGEKFLDSIYLFKPGASNWELFGKMEQPIAFSTAIVLGGQIHLLGGQNDTGTVGDHKIFFPQRAQDGDNAWTEAASLPEARYGMNSALLADMIYIVGGMSDKKQVLPMIQYFPPKDEWVEISDSPIEIGYLPALIPYETKLFVIGGKNTSGFSTEAFSYQAIYTILVPIVR